MTMTKFDENIEIWKSMKDNKEKQESFFYEKLLDDVVERAREYWLKNENTQQKEFDLLITMSGFSPETSIIASKVIKAKKVLVISSKNSFKSIDIIGKHVTPDIGFSNFHHLTCNPTDPLEIYKLIKNKVSEITDKGKLKAIVDITGGKKIMSAAAGLVAWQLDMPICYIESKKYDPELRRPVPGGEELLYLPNPITLYGHEELARGKVLFNKGQYLEAHDRFSELSKRLEQPKYAKFLKDLSKLYSSWCDVDLEGLGNAINIVEQHLNDTFVTQHHLNNELATKINKQITFLKKLKESDELAILLNFYLLGLFYKNNLKRYDFSCLFFYRAMEGCFVHRLQTRYNINVIKPDYSKQKITEEDLEERYVAISTTTNKDLSYLKLPQFPLGYANSAAILMALKDDMFDKKYKFNFAEIISMGTLRNQSILAHGMTSLKPKDAKRLEFFAQRFLVAFYDTLEEDCFSDELFEEQIESLKFVSLETEE